MEESKLQCSINKLGAPLTLHYFFILAQWANHQINESEVLHATHARCATSHQLCPKELAWPDQGKVAEHITCTDNLWSLCA